MPIQWNKSALAELEQEAKRKVSEATKRAYEKASLVEGTERKAQAFASELKRSGIDPNISQIRKLFSD